MATRRELSCETVPAATDTVGQSRDAGATSRAPSVAAFVDGLTYNRLSADEKVNKWTLRKDDIIVKGIVDSQISKKDLVSNYPYQMTITRVNTNDFGSLKHWFIGGA